MAEDEKGSSSEEVHNRLYKTQILIASAIIGYMELRFQLLTDWLRNLEQRFNNHSQLHAHEGQAQATGFLRDLIYFVMNEIGLNTMPFQP